MRKNPRFHLFARSIKSLFFCLKFSFSRVRLVSKWFAGCLIYRNPYCVIQKINWFLLSSCFGGVPPYYGGTDTMNQSMDSILQKHHQKQRNGVVWNIGAKDPFCYFYEYNMIIVLTGWISKLFYVMEWVKQSFARRVRTQQDLTPLCLIRGVRSCWVLTFSCRQSGSSDYYRDDPNPEYEP